MSDFNDFNQAVIAEFRANGGEVAGPFANASLLLLTTIGARSGQPRTRPLAYNLDSDRIIIVAGNGGAPTNPDWYHNILAHPIVTVEIGHERFQARAVEILGSEHERLYAKVAEERPELVEYQQKNRRLIPVIALERIG
jgi:deazaflavin-dependent oxidoreductase (nitroreductase family)